MSHNRKNLDWLSPKENFCLYRRQFLYGSLLTGIAGLLQACGGQSFRSELPTSPATGGNGSLDIPNSNPPVSEPNPIPAPQPAPMPNPVPQPQPAPMPNPVPQPQPQPNPNPSATPRPIPSNKVNLSDFGGVPGASSSVIISAFNQAIAKLKSLGGGTLFIAPGLYHLGNYQSGTIISLVDLQNVLISGYGAKIQINTTATETQKTPVIFNFQNPNNVTVAGLSFYDSGAKIDQRIGAVCLFILAQKKCSGFKTVDCVAENVNNFVQAPNSSTPYLFEGFDIHATVKNSYYGFSAYTTGRFSKCNLSTLNVRRAFISQGVRDWDITVTAHRTSGSGANAHVVLSALPNLPVMDVKVNIKASGALNGYGCLGEIIHQGPDGSYSYARNVTFNFAIANATSAATTGVISFAAEPSSGLPAGGIRSSTKGAFENVSVTGTVSGPYSGKLVANPSVSSATTNSIFVDQKLSQYQNLSALPSYFKVVAK